MVATAVSTPSAPKVGPFMSQAVVSNGFVFSAGSLGIDPATGKMVEGTVADRAAQALRNLDAVFKAAGTSLAKAVKVNIYLSSMDHVAQVNEAYTTFFTSDPKPARTCFAGAVLPLDAELEIEAIATLE